MKQIEIPQILDVETAGESISQLDRRKLVKAERNTPTIAEVDFTPVPDVILSKSAHVLYRAYEGRWRPD